MRKVEFDKLTYNFQKVSLTIWRPLFSVLKVLLVSVSFTIVGYGLVALVFSTRTERQLKAEIKHLDSLYTYMSETDDIVSNVITGLQVKDAYIYEQMFHSNAPNVDPISNLDIFYGSDTIPDTKLISYTTKKAQELEDRVERVNGSFARIEAVINQRDFVMPPMEMPLRNITYSQFGACIGQKVQPFTKTLTDHDGLDIIAPQGDPVFATADGVISKAIKSSRGKGNTVEIVHEGGYTTMYNHLSDIYVKKGQAVKKGARIGAVGMTGSSFAPHLHYEIWFEDQCLNPVDYIFSSVSPDEYANILYMAANTAQSMD